jgi:Cu+-exporting ATPase
LAIDISPLEAMGSPLRDEGETIVYVAVDGRAAGLFGITDVVKTSAGIAVRELRDAGIHVVMATGDGAKTAERVARTLGIDAVHANLSPDDKTELVKRLQREGHVVAMAGDGVNDAPALAAADVGIAMGTGTDVAIQSATVTLVKGDLRGVLRAHRLGRATVANIYQNLFFAFAYNALGIPLAAGALYPAFGWLLSPMVASAAMSLSSVSVITNALRLRRASL